MPPVFVEVVLHERSDGVLAGWPVTVNVSSGDDRRIVAMCVDLQDGEMVAAALSATTRLLVQSLAEAAR